jgi:hypothetical protein
MAALNMPPLGFANTQQQPAAARSFARRVEASMLHGEVQGQQSPSL